MNLEDDILIERFLRNELSEEEKLSFLKRLEDDLNFKEHYLLEKQLFESLNEESWSFIDNVDDAEVKEYEELYNSAEVKAIREAIKGVAKTKTTNNRSKVIALVSGFAAAIIFILASNIFLKETVDAETLYANHIQLEKLPSFVTRSETENAKLIDAEILFKAKRYEDALAIFSIELEENKKSAVFIYKALSEIELKKFDEAKNTLKTLINSDLIDAEKGQWYLGLLYLKSNNKKEAKKVFKKITKEKLYKAKEAEDILDKM
ncbi:tetratricopeptide repeat protein [Tenacibaculum sp. ZS6-P6]|uniref:tetratricopeptide repeat protein n=1 Tax=Tenacibaculum sp. ZS6-P6 TaxID=3447503 RepID=UPI003F98DBE2